VVQERQVVTVTKDSPEDCREWGGSRESYKVQMEKFEVFEYVCSPRLNEPLC